MTASTAPGEVSSTDEDDNITNVTEEDRAQFVDQYAIILF